MGMRVKMFCEKGKVCIESMKLKSGKLQVEFQWNGKNDIPLHGYLLTDGNRAFREVMYCISREINRMEEPDWYYHKHLYQMGKKEHFRTEMIMFRGKNAKNLANKFRNFQL